MRYNLKAGTGSWTFGLQTPSPMNNKNKTKTFVDCKRNEGFFFRRSGTAHAEKEYIIL